jgi:3-oxoacyl-[acyl-carrier protein] reductase
LNSSDPVVIITGGTRGIGAAVVEACIKTGAVVYASGTDQQSLKKSKARFGSQVKFFELNLESPDSIEDCKSLIDGLPRVDALVNNAGINRINLLEEIPSDEWESIQKVNLFGPFEMLKMVVPKMKTQKSGRIVNIGSIFGVVGKEKRVSYSASKWGLVGLTKSAALELGSYNILVNTVSPGVVLTDLTEKVLGDTGIKKIRKEIPLGRLGLPEEIARTVLFLIGEENTYITGQNLVIDGGLTSA